MLFRSRNRLPTPAFLGFPCGSVGKESTCNVGDLGSIPGLGRSPGEGKGYPLQYSGLENSVCGVAELDRTEQLSLSLPFPVATLSSCWVLWAWQSEICLRPLNSAHKLLQEASSLPSGRPEICLPESCSCFRTASGLITIITSSFLSPHAEPLQAGALCCFPPEH